MHRRLGGVDSHSQGFAARIRTGLADVTWPGRCQQLQDAPAVYLDGAINGESARLLVESLDGRLNQPVISVIAVPDDKDFAGVYAALGEVSQGLILTETERNPILHFPDRDVAINVARQHNANVTYEVTLAAAVERALQQAGEEGTVLIVGTQSILADATLLWGYAYLQI
jgi:dihydrofolate synthase/folylpolyglutamate synthase